MMIIMMMLVSILCGIFLKKACLVKLFNLLFYVYLLVPSTDRSGSSSKCLRRKKCLFYLELSKKKMYVYYQEIFLLFLCTQSQTTKQVMKLTYHSRKEQISISIYYRRSTSTYLTFVLSSSYRL